MSENQKVYTPNEIVQGLISSDLVIQIEMAGAALKLLETPNYDVACLVSAGIVIPLIKTLAVDKSYELLMDSVRCLICICKHSDNHKFSAVYGGLIPALKDVLVNSFEEIKRMNILLEDEITNALDYYLFSLLHLITLPGPELRASVLEQTLSVITPYFSANYPSNQLSIDFLYKMCRKRIGQPIVELRLVYPALTILVTCMRNDNIFRVTHRPGCLAIGSLTEELDYIEEVQAVPGMMQFLTELVKDKMSTRRSGFRVICNMLKGTDAQRVRCQNTGYMTQFVDYIHFYFYGEPDPRKHNDIIDITACILEDKDRMKQALDMKILTVLFIHLDQCYALSISSKKKLLKCIGNLFGLGCTKVLNDLTIENLSLFCRYLRYDDEEEDDEDDEEVLIIALEGLANILKATAEKGPEELNELHIKLEVMKVVDRLDKLQLHSNKQVRNKTVHIIDTYLNIGDDSSDN